MPLLKGLNTMKDDNTNDILLYLLLFGLLDGFDLTFSAEEGILPEALSEPLESCEEYLFFDDEW